MTIEGAIKRFESLIVMAEDRIRDFESCWPSWKSGFRKEKELYEMAVNALRAQQTPTKLDRTQWGGCDCCTVGDGEFRYLLDKWGDEDYCPKCGRPLTEEAWAELESKIGGLCKNE
mgnify:FL=1